MEDQGKKTLKVGFASALGGSILTLLILFGLANAPVGKQVGGIRESSTFADADMADRVVQELRARQVEFQRDGLTIWYRVGDRDTVRDAFNIYLDSQPQFVLYREDLANEFVGALAANGIEAKVSQVLEPKAGYGIIVSGEHQAEADRILREEVFSTEP